MHGRACCADSSNISPDSLSWQCHTEVERPPGKGRPFQLKQQKKEMETRWTSVKTECMTMTPKEKIKE